MGTGMNTEGFSEEVSLEGPLKDDGRRGIIGHLEGQSEQRPGPGGNVGRQDQADPRAGDVAREPQQRRLKPFREKPCGKTRHHPRGSQHGIYYTPSSKNVEAEMEAEDAVSRSFPFGK